MQNHGAKSRAPWDTVEYTRHLHLLCIRVLVHSVKVNEAEIQPSRSRSGHRSWDHSLGTLLGSLHHGVFTSSSSLVRSYIFKFTTRGVCTSLVHWTGPGVHTYLTTKSKYKHQWGQLYPCNESKVKVGAASGFFLRAIGWFSDKTSSLKCHFWPAPYFILLGPMSSNLQVIQESSNGRSGTRQWHDIIPTD